MRYLAPQKGKGEQQMRRVTLMLAAVAMLVLLFAVVAYAAEIQGSDNSEELYETNRNDKIVGHRGDDDIFAGRFLTMWTRRRGIGTTTTSTFRTGTALTLPMVVRASTNA